MSEVINNISHDNWSTPKWLMILFKDWFDPCPLNGNNGLNIEWKDKTYVNPPYSNPTPWVEKAIIENKKGKTIAMLLKLDTSTKWFLMLQEANAHFITFFGRLKFSNSKSALFPSVLVILENNKAKCNHKGKCDLMDSEGYCLTKNKCKDKVI